MNKRTQRTVKNGFTLLELLVVIGIIGILVGIIMPTLAWGKRRAKIAACQSNLKGIGPAFRSYSLSYRGKLPDATNMPSLEISELPSLPIAMKGYTNEKNFQCPADIYVTYYEREGSSFEYNVSEASGKSMDTLRHGDGYTWLLRDYEPFHGTSSFSDGAINFLYANGDVDSTTNDD
jgi:prepilin-type N-terminal cleavage/methylation domain-containing protein